MLWVLLIVLSAENGFKANTQGGVAIQAVEFQSESLCRAAAKEVLTVNGNRGFFISTTCVQKAR